MRAGPVAAGGLLLLVAALGLACKTYKDEGEKVPPGYVPPTYPPAPGRQVYDDGGLIMGGGGVSGGGGVVVVGNDAGTYSGTDAAPGGGSDLGGGGAFDAAPGADTGGACTLLSQSCGPNMGCYPAPAGQGRCGRSDPGVAEGAQCAEPSNCAPGLTCVNSLCATLCSTAQALCTNGRRCVALGSYEGIGYCLP